MGGMKQEAAKCKGKRASHHLALTAIREGNYAWPWKGARLGLSTGGMRPAPAKPVLMELQLPCRQMALHRPWAASQLPGEAGEQDHAWRCCCSQQDAEYLPLSLTSDPFPKRVSSPGLAFCQLILTHSLGGYRDKVTVAWAASP